MGTPKDDKPLHFGVEIPEDTHEKGMSQETTRGAASLTTNGKTGNLANLFQEPVPDDTATFKPPAMRLNTAGNASDPDKPRTKSKSDTQVIPNAGRMLSLRLHSQASGSNKHGAGYRQWLAGKSKDELIELLIALDQPAPDIEATDTIAKIRVDEASSALADTYEIPEGVTYLRLPPSCKTPIDKPIPDWQIMLVSLDQSGKPCGLLINGEITVGRGSGDTKPDLDLTSFDAKTKGISRLHALFRPQMRHLMLVDNDSRNGTFWNRLRIPAQTEQPLKDGDVIAFGRANFLVKIVKAPSSSEPRTLN